MSEAELELRRRRGELQDWGLPSRMTEALINAARRVGAEQRDREWLDSVGEVARDMGWVRGKRGWRKIGGE